MSKLVLKYEFDPSYLDPTLPRDDFGRLSVLAETERFLGRGGFWVQWQDVKEFGESLGIYPIPSDRPIAVQWGFDMQEGDDLILRLEISPHDTRGNLRVEFEIADDYDPQHRVKGSFVTNYPEIEAFRIDVARMMDREADQAVLNGQ